VTSLLAARQRRLELGDGLADREAGRALARRELVERVQELDDAVRHDARARRPIGAAGMPTLLRPVRYTLWPG